MYSFKNFKNFADTQLNLFESVTLMIGKNGSGKSNAIEGVELLAQIAHGRPLHEIVDVGRGNGGMFEIRGGLQGCLSYQADPSATAGAFELKFGDATFVFDGQKQDIKYSVTVGFPDAKIQKEKLTVGDRVIFDAKVGRSDILKVTYDNFKSGVNKPAAQLPADRSVLSRYETFIDLGNKNAKQRDATKLVRVLEGHLNAAFVFDPAPRLMREYERMGQSVLQKNGSNLSSVLHSLKQGKEEKQATLFRILDLIRQLPEEPFTEFDFVETRARDVLLGLKREDGTVTDARSLSDGTLRALAIIAALETVPENSRIVIEEIDNGIHPSRIKSLVDAVWECSKRRKLNILVTTHNPATLDGLDAEQLKAVVLCYLDDASRTSKLIRLTELPRVESLMEQGRLGDLVTRRVLEKYLLPDFEENQKSKTKAWLESLA
jgi:ABC-type branched-subunit amino acid transport system ATPase component